MPAVPSYMLKRSPNNSTIAGSVTISRVDNSHASCHFHVGSGYAGGSIGIGRPLPCKQMRSKQDCCDACERHGPPQQTEACVAAVFLNTSNTSHAGSSESSLSLRQPNCLLYGAEAAGTAPVPLAAASLCRPPAARERTAARSWLTLRVNSTFSPPSPAAGSGAM